MTDVFDVVTTIDYVNTKIRLLQRLGNDSSLNCLYRRMNEKSDA